MSDTELKRMTEAELNILLDTEIKDAIGFLDSELSKDREDATKFYLGQPMGNENEGRSQYVSRDVQDTIEWIMPQLVEIFLSAEHPVTFEPNGPDDIEDALNETLYTNHVIFQKNGGFSIIHDYIKDGLMVKTGLVKHWWDDSEKKEREEYTNLSNDELDLLLADPEIEVIEHTAIEEGGTEVADFSGTAISNDVVVIRTQKTGKVILENIPPEEFVVSRRSLRKISTDFACHKTTKTISDLIEMGFPKKDVIFAARQAVQDTDVASSAERLARHVDDSTEPRRGISARKDFAMQELPYEECYIKVDADGDGIAELRLITRVGHNIFENEEIEEHPWSIWSPIMMPHKLIGRSVADLVMDIQELKTNLIRSMLDNINLHNHGKWSVIEGMVNLDDLLTARPMGIVRQRVANAVQRLDAPNLPPEAFQMLGYIDHVREERSGVSKASQGLDENALGSNTAVGTVQMVLSAAQQRVLLIARVFAETGMKDLFRSVHNLILQNDSGERSFRVTGKFVTVNPSNFKTREDLAVSAGIGSANKKEKVLNLDSIKRDLIEINATGANIVTPQNAYNLESEKIHAMGFANADMFITNPENQEKEEEGPSLEEQKLQLEVGKLKMEAKVDQVELQIKQGELQVKKAKQQLDVAKFEHEKDIDEVETQLKIAELRLEAGQERPVKIGN